MLLESFAPETPDLPPGITKMQIKADLRAYQATLQPCGAEALAVCLKELTDWIDTFQSVPPEKRKAAIKHYGDVLREIPSDLAYEAVQRVKRNYRYPSLPKPGDLKAAISDDLLQRRRERNVLQSAVLTGRERPRPSRRTQPTEEQQARVREMLARVKAGMHPLAETEQAREAG
ncbi:hypothetical protein [Hwanghaeella sp.]|uniref:hypothetical protein n=1 Tax=Hwanghaeella sp. TaxID=2605943 RepID=UPI003CCBF191